MRRIARKTAYLLISAVLAVAYTGCSSGGSGVDGSVGGDDDWLIPLSEVRDGGPGKDGIPALTNPPFISAEQERFLNDSDLVVGIRVGDEARAYPHLILDWHEIVNDTIEDTHFSVTYCPLTGTGIGWNRELSGGVTTFGVSGLLYNSNLIAYDRATDSNWSQMQGRGVNGAHIGRDIETVQVVETTWETWKILFPETKVVSPATGHNKPYGVYPYGSYRTDDRLIFQVDRDDARLHKKERIHGILVDDESKVYPIDRFPDGLVTLNDTVNGLPVVVVGSSSLNVATSYERDVGGAVLIFDPLENALPAVMQDNEGTTWDILGRGIEGPREGEHLESTMSYNAYWFAWGAFFWDAEIHPFAD